MRKRENALEHQGHDADENQRAPNFVRENTIQFVAERLPRRREFGSNGLLDFRDARVSPFNGGPAPVYAVRFEPLSGGGHGILNFLRIMLPARRQRFFIAEQQQRLRGGLQSPFLKSLGQQAGQPGGFNPKQSGQLAKSNLGGTACRHP